MAIENLKKHAGQLLNTGVRVAVIFRKLPTDPTFCLIVETERLPDSYHDYLIQCLNSKEAKETNDFFEVLNRRTFPDGLNCLTALHQRGHLRKEPVSNIVMLPLPGQAVPLALINATIDGKIEEYKASTTAKPPTETVPVDTRTEEEKTAAAAAIAAKMQDPSAMAKGLIMQAELLEQDAASKREEAYALDPSSKPGRGRPPTPEELKAKKAEERKDKRRERDRANAEAKRVADKKAAMDAKINAKIVRDAARNAAKAAANNAVTPG